MALVWRYDSRKKQHGFIKKFESSYGIMIVISSYFSACMQFDLTVSQSCPLIDSVVFVTKNYF